VSCPRTQQCPWPAAGSRDEGTNNEATVHEASVLSSTDAKKPVQQLAVVAQ